MSWYKPGIHILVILFVFNFVPVLAAPVVIREVCKVCADPDVVDRGDDVIIMSGKRAEGSGDPLTGYHGLTQASSISVSQPDYISTSSDRDLPQGPPSMSNYASEVHQETTNPIQLSSSAPGEMQRPPFASGGTEVPWSSPIRRPSYASGGTDLPWYSPSEIIQRPSYKSGGTELPWQSPSERIRRPLYASGGTEPPWHPSDNTGRGGVQLVQPETTSNIPKMKAKKINDNLMAGSSMRTKPEIIPSLRTKMGKWAPATESEPALSSSGKITPASSSQVPPPLEQEGHLDQTPTKQPISQLESFLTDLASESKLRPRIFATAGGAA